MKGFIILLLVSLIGCSGTINSLRLGTMMYCAKPEEARKVIRIAVGAALAPNSIKVNCIQDN